MPAGGKIYAPSTWILGVSKVEKTCYGLTGSFAWWIACCQGMQSCRIQRLNIEAFKEANPDSMSCMAQGVVE
jgi:hypothetical protein